MSADINCGSLGVGNFKAEVVEAAGDLQVISQILIAIGHHDVEVHAGWWAFFGRSIEAVGEHLLEEAERLE